MTLNHIYKRNLLSFDLVPSNHLINGNLTFDNPIPLILLSNTNWLLFIYSTISFKTFVMTNCESYVISLLTILVSSSRLKVLRPDIMTSVLGGILLTSYYIIIR